MCILQCNGTCSREPRCAAVIKITSPPGLFLPLSYRPPSFLPFRPPRDDGKNCYLHNSQSNARVRRFEDFTPAAVELKNAARHDSCVPQRYIHIFYFFFRFCFLLFANISATPFFSSLRALPRARFVGRTLGTLF